MGNVNTAGETEVIIHSRHVDLSGRFRDHVNDKLDRVGKFGVPISRVDVEVSKENNPRLADRAYEVELTCRSRGPVIRAEAFSTDHYSAFDLAFTRLTERLRRYADRNRPHRGGRHAHKGALSHTPIDETLVVEGADVAAPGDSTQVEGAVSAGSEGDASDYGFTEVEQTVFEQGPVVVREKTHVSAPMTVEEAVTRMELIGHDFFLFQDVDTGAHSVVYRRRGYDFGLIRISDDEA